MKQSSGFLTLILFSLLYIPMSYSASEVLWPSGKSWMLSIWGEQAEKLSKIIIPASDDIQCETKPSYAECRFFYRNRDDVSLDDVFVWFRGELAEILYKSLHLPEEIHDSPRGYPPIHSKEFERSGPEYPAYVFLAQYIPWEERYIGSIRINGSAKIVINDN